MKTTRSAALRANPHLVGDHDHRHAAAGKVHHDVEDLVDHFRVQRGGRLVEQHDLRVHGQRPGDRDALLLATGQLSRVLVGLIADPPDPVEQLFRLFLRCRGGEFAYLSGGRG